MDTGTLLNFLGTIFKTFRQVTLALKFIPTRRIGPVSIGVLVSTSIYISITPSTSTFLENWLTILPWALNKNFVHPNFVIELV